MDNGNTNSGGRSSASRQEGNVARARNNSTNDSVSSIGRDVDDEEMTDRRIRPSCVVINRKRKQQQNDNLSALTVLKSEHFQLEYKLKKTQTDATVKKVQLEERVAEATVRKMEEDARALAVDTRIKILRERDRLKKESNMTEEQLDKYLPLD